jgi:hypothetical protein
MAKINNVNVEAMARFAAQVEQDPGAAKKLKSVTGQWSFAEGAPQFRAELEYPGGAHAVETDFAPFMGGEGLRPDPVSYCMYGFASCFAGTFVAIAAAEKLEEIRRLAEDRCPGVYCITNPIPFNSRLA